MHDLLGDEQEATEPAHSKIAKELSQVATSPISEVSRARLLAGAALAAAVATGAVGAAASLNAMDALHVVLSLSAGGLAGAALTVPDVARPRRRLPKSTGSAFHAVREEASIPPDPEREHAAEDAAFLRAH
jgi:hypothetical protein